MDLILWRHCEAEDAGPGESDMARRLTPRGEKQARKVARWFLEHRPKDLRILVSPAERTLQTAQALDLPFEVVPAIGTGADAAGLIAAAAWPHAHGAVMLVGHQPTLGEVAAKLLSGREAGWNIKKGALWWFSADDGQPTLLAVVAAGLL
jgi:phosphohistidine phosphatase